MSKREHKSRQITRKEARERILACIRDITREWSRSGRVPLQMCEGVAFSILATIDGSCPGIPAMDLVLRPHPDNKAFHEREGTPFFKDGMVINDNCSLHDLWSKK